MASSYRVTMSANIPDIDLSTATTHGSDTSVGIVGRWLPALDVTLYHMCQ